MSHTIAFRHNPEYMSGYTYKITCHEPPTADCHLSHPGAAEGCTWPTGAAVGDRCSCNGILRLTDACSYREYFTGTYSDDIFETYGGTGNVPVHDGPIDFTWRDETWRWHYTEPPKGGGPE